MRGCATFLASPLHTIQQLGMKLYALKSRQVNMCMWLTNLSWCMTQSSPRPSCCMQTPSRWSQVQSLDPRAVSLAMNVARTRSFFNRHQRTLTCSWTYSNSRMRDTALQKHAVTYSHINSCINAMNYVTYFTPARSRSNYSAYRLSSTHTFRCLHQANR